MEDSSSTDRPASGAKLVPQKLNGPKEGDPVFVCNLCDILLVHKIAQGFVPALATACVDNTTGDMFRNPGSVAADIRKDMVNYLTERSESFVAESVVLDGETETSDHPYEIIASFIDEFAGTKRNLFSRVSGWVRSDKREDKIDDFAQEMENNGFWPLDKREEIVKNMLKNVDFKNVYHCDMKFRSAEELAVHVSTCSYRPMNCENEGCDDTFSANQAEKHGSVCPFKIIPCEQNCSDLIMRREMDRHCITFCPMKLVNCPFYAVGCQLTIPQSKIEEHRSMDLSSHILYIIQGIHREASMEDLKERVEQLEKLSSGNLAECRDVRSLTSKIKDLDAELGALVDTARNNTSEEVIGVVAKPESLEVGYSNKDAEIKDSEAKPQSSEVSPNKDSEETETKVSEEKPESAEVNPNEDREAAAKDAEANPEPLEVNPNIDREEARTTEGNDYEANPEPLQFYPNEDGDEAIKTETEDSKAKPESTEVNPNEDGEEAIKTETEDSKAKLESTEDNPNKDLEEVKDSVANIQESLRDAEVKPLSSDNATTNKDDEETAETTVNDSEEMPPRSNNVNETAMENSAKDVEGKLPNSEAETANQNSEDGTEDSKLIAKEVGN